jgi:antitoxin ParD1/3/4
MPTASLNISLPEPLKAFVDAQVETGDYGTPSDYVRELILDDRDRRLARLEERLLENLKSKPIDFSDEELAAGNFVDLCRKKLRESR